MNQKQLILLFAGFSFFPVFAQQGVVASGINFSGTGGSISYSVGQISDDTLTGGAISITQGIQQPFEISEILRTGNFPESILLKAYPNPAANELTLNAGNSDIKGMSWQICDMSGKVIADGIVIGNVTNIDLSYVKTGAYLLKVTKADGTKVFKIIRN